MTRDGLRGPVYAAAKHVNLKGVRARCDGSHHVTCNMVGSASVDDRRGGQSDHSGKTALNFLKFTRPILTNAQQSITSNVFRWTCDQLRSEFRTIMWIQETFFYFYVSTLAICESMSRPRAVMTPEELSCVLKPFVTSRSWLVYDEPANVSETKLHKRERVDTRCLLDGPPRAFTKSRVHTFCCVSGFEATGGLIRDVASFIERLGGNHDESAAEPLQDSESKLAKESQVRVCRVIHEEPDYDRHLCGTWLRCGVRLRTPFGLASFAGRDRTSRDVEPALCARVSATNRLIDGTVVSDGFEHTVTDITCQELQATAAADNK